MKLEQRFFKSWVFSLSGKNLFDEKYDTHLSSFTNQTTFKTTVCGYPGAGRSVSADVKYEF
jgi:iron complex outermembrane receptor protein